jgi:prepilin-type N-terminal cleavage/methylation domain-containing protein
MRRGRAVGRGARAARQGGAAGFTLIEVMLALTILVSIVALVWGSISFSLRSSDQMLGNFDQFQQIRLAVDRMSREFSAAYITSHANRKENLPGFKDLSNEDKVAAVEGALGDGAPPVVGGAQENAEPRDRYIETAFVGKSDEVHFTSLAHVRTQPGELASDQAEVSYMVRTSKRRDPEGRLLKELVRREDSSPDDDVEKGGVVYTLIDDVQEVKFEYWEQGEDGNEESSGKWIDAWDSRKADQRGKLPSRVKITVEVATPGTHGRWTEARTGGSWAWTGNRAP